jgi:hypothetical protein
MFAVSYVIILTLTLPKTDLAYGQWPFEDPLVFPTMAFVAGASGLVGWPLFYFLGRRVPVGIVAKFTGVTTLLFILVATPFQPRIAWFGSYFVCLVALVYCHVRYRTACGNQTIL